MSSALISVGSSVARGFGFVRGGTARAGFCVRLEVGWLLTWIGYGVGSSFARVLS